MCAVRQKTKIDNNCIIMKLKTKPFLSAIATLAIVCSCCNLSVTGLRTDALEDAAWHTSEWISAMDAEVVTGKINGKNFLFFSDITYRNLDAIWIYVFNKSMVDDFQLVDPYELVESGKWTMDKLYSITKTLAKGSELP